MITKTPTSNQKKADSFKKKAQSAFKKYEDWQSRSATYVRNTPKRARQYDSCRIDAEDNLRLGKALQALSIGWETDSVPEKFRELTKDEVWRLVFHGSIVHSYYTISEAPTPAIDTELAREFRAWVQATLNSQKTESEIENEKRLASVNETKKKIDQLEADVRFGNIPGFFPTPKPIIEQMLGIAFHSDVKPSSGYSMVIEPSAGKGDIADEVRAKHPELPIRCVEINHKLGELLQAKGYDVLVDDFLTYNLDRKDQKNILFLMNPPFERKAWIKHICHAGSMCRMGDVIVSVVPGNATISDIQIPNVVSLFLDEHDGNFKNAFNPTSVATKLLTIRF